MSSRIEETKEVEVAVLRRCADDVVVIEIRRDARVEAKQISEVLDTMARMTTGMVGVIVDARGASSMTREAMELTANSPVNDRTAATAILVQSAVSVLLGNFFIRFSRPPYPCRLFKSGEQARQWVLDHLAEKH